MSESAFSLPDDRDTVRRALVEWYEEDHRGFPWRETTDPYEILVSEVMSQQTQLERVVEAFDGFVERWPDAERLAAADRSAVVSSGAITASATTIVRAISTRPPDR